MDAETRHQLKQNEFAEALARLSDFADARFWYWVAAIVVILGAYLGYRVWQRQQDLKLQSTWGQLLELNTRDLGGVAGTIIRLQAMINENTSPELVAAARLRLGRALTLQAYEDTAQRESLLREAEATYVAAAEAAEAPNSIAAAASYALGGVYESLREFDEARRVYESLERDARFAGTPFEQLAAERLATLGGITAEVVFMPGNRPPPPPAQPEPEPEAVDVEGEFGPPAPPETQPTATLPASRPTGAEDSVAPAQNADWTPATQPAEEESSPQPTGAQEP